MRNRSLHRAAAALVPLLLVLVSAARPGTAQTVKIGVFDPQRVLQETAEGARLQARLSALQEKRRKEIEALQNEIRSEEQDFLGKAASLSAEKLKQTQLKIERKRFELESMQKAATRELQLEMEQARSEFERHLLAVVEKLGKEEGYTVILQTDVVGYFAPSIDVTETLIRLVDEAAGGGDGS